MKKILFSYFSVWVRSWMPMRRITNWLICCIHSAITVSMHRWIQCTILLSTKTITSRISFTHWISPWTMPDFSTRRETVRGQIRYWPNPGKRNGTGKVSRKYHSTPAPGNCGNCYVWNCYGQWQNNQLPAARETAEEAVSQLEQVKDSVNLAEAYNLSGVIHRRLFMLDNAISLYQKALAITEDLQNYNLAAIIVSNIPFYTMKRARTMKPYRFLVKCLRIHKPTHLPSTIASGK